MDEFREDTAHAAGEPLHKAVHPRDRNRHAEVPIAQVMIVSKQREHDVEAV